LKTVKDGVYQNKPITIHVKEKHFNIPFTIEVYPNAKGFLPFRVITSAGTGLWNTWETEEEIYNCFRGWSII
jgi:hypothetical protein